MNKISSHISAKTIKSSFYTYSIAFVLVKHGYTASKMTSNIRTWDCGRPGTELMTVICGVKLWKW